MFKGHINLGKRVTVYGDNAMHWGVTIYTRRWGYLCFRLPFRSCGRWWPLYFYASPNATPWASTFMIGGEDRDSREKAPIRRKLFGHNFNTDLLFYRDVNGDLRRFPNY